MVSKTYSGIFTPNKRGKYKGDASNIVYRSNWEKQVMLWCDKTDAVVEWASEEIVIPYYSDVDKRYHRYFVDFWIKMADGTVRLVEVKPAKQTKPPRGTVKWNNANRQQRMQMTEQVKTYIVNSNKWDFAKKFAKARGWTFEIWTEETLKGMGLLPKLPTMKKMPSYKRKKAPAKKTR